MQLPQILMLNAGLIAAAMLAIWAVSLWLRDASIVDIFWGLGFVLISSVTFSVTDGGTRAFLLATLTSLWGLRLSAYLAYRNHGRGEDPRYGAMRKYRGESFWWFSLISVFVLQGVIMWLVSLPVQVGQTSGAAMSLLNWIGVGVWAIGFLFEAIGDYQLSRFKSDPASAGKVLDHGLWRYTRHPNYFGNAMIWWGLFLVAVTPATVWLIISPVGMTFLLLKVSGVALLERDLKGRSQEYRDYMESTSVFIPWPPRRAI